MVFGTGSTSDLLNEQHVYDICGQAFEAQNLAGKKVLCVIPDHTRTAPIDMMFRNVYKLLADQTEALDFIVALGTHPPMTDEAIYQRVGITAAEHEQRYSQARFFNHHWNDPDQLAVIGTITEDEVAEISDGLLRQSVDVTINKMALEYDVLLIIGPTFPHEVVGFSGGSKYLFPGIAGADIIDMFHWLGALITSPVIIGTPYTPVRAVVEKSASFLKNEIYALAMVVQGNELAGLYAGPSNDAWAKAAELSDKLHIVYKDKPFKSVLARAPEMYDDLWTGAKCMYKMEPVVADGGELIIWAPHIKEVSVTHGEKIKAIGYHVRDYFLKQMDKFKNVPGGVMAHSTHVRGVGAYEDGIEKPRVRVVLASQIPPEECEAINLEYRDPDSIDPAKWQDKEDEGLLYVPKAGEMLYRLKDDPFRKDNH